MHGTNSTLSWGSGSLGREKLFNIQFAVKICEFPKGGKIGFKPVVLHTRMKTKKKQSWTNP
jgi:hypothetical protein